MATSTRNYGLTRKGYRPQLTHHYKQMFQTSSKSELCCLDFYKCPTDGTKLFFSLWTDFHFAWQTCSELTLHLMNSALKISAA